MRRIIIEEIPSIFACCDTEITAADIASASRFQNERRRREHLAWRRVVRRELGRNIRIEYNEVGAPIVDVTNTHISVAHGAGCVAVAISDKKVGIDIERFDRNYERIASRIMSGEEQQLSSEERWAAYVWAAKESLYKLYGEQGVDLIDDIHILSYDASKAIMRAQLRNDKEATVELSTHHDDAVVAVAYFE
jgi:phosphopantetheinyl transferase